MKRIATSVAAIAVALVVIYASIFPVAELAGEVVVLRSRDESGAVHETRMWVVDRKETPWVRGRPYRGWFRRIEANPKAELLRNGRWRPVEASPSLDPADAAAVERRIREKYGWAHSYTNLIARTSSTEVPVQLETRAE